MTREKAAMGEGVQQSSPTDLAAFRHAFATWAYETAFTPTRRGTLADRLNGGARDRLSPWWTSLLYERHPAMSPALFELYQKIWRPAFNPVEQIRPCRMARCKAWLIALRHRACAAVQPFLALLRLLHWLLTVRRLLPPATLTPEALHTPVSAGDIVQAPQFTAMTKSSPCAITVAAYFPHCDAAQAALGRFRSHYWEDLHTLLDIPAQKSAQAFSLLDDPLNKRYVTRNTSTQTVHSYQPLQHEQATVGKVHWLFVRIRMQKQSFRNHIALRDLFRSTAPTGTTFHFIEEFLPWRAIARALYRFVRMALASWLEESHFRAACTLPMPDSAPTRRSASFYRLLQADYAASFRGWRGLERCLLDEALRGFVLQAGPQQLTLFPQENCPWERMLTHAQHLHTQGGPVIGAQHSTIRPADFRYVDDARTYTDPRCCHFQPDILAVNGAHALALLRQAGTPPERIYLVEALRYQKTVYSMQEKPISPSVTDEQLTTAPAQYFRKRPSTVAAEQSTISWKGCQQAKKVAQDCLSMPSMPRDLLVLTGFFAAEVAAHMRLLAAVNAAGLLQGWRVTVKGHPWLDARCAAARYCPSTLTTQLIFTEEPLPSCFARRPALVWTSNSTSAAVDTALAHIPLLIMAPHMTFDMCPLSTLPGVHLCNTVEHVAAALAAPPLVDIPPSWLHTEPGLQRWSALLNMAIQPRA